jgi:hypothetical protein
VSEQQTTSEYLNLMREMGAEKWEGFNPIAPRSHRWMMDAAEPEDIRAHGWALWRTIDRDPEGKSGPPKKKRTPIAHDVRVRKNGYLTVEHMAEDLGVPLRVAKVMVSRGVEKGTLGMDEDGRLWPRADGPEPERFKTLKGEGEEKVEGVLYKMGLDGLVIHFQSLDKTRLAEYLSRCLAMPEPFRKRLQAIDSEQRTELAWEYLKKLEFWDQAKADAIAAVRAGEYRDIDAVFERAGVQRVSPAGRKRVERELMIDLKVRVEPETFFAQRSNGHSVQNGNGILNKTQNGSVRSAASLSGSHSLHSSHSEVNPRSVENSAPEDKVAPTARPSGPDETLPDEVTEQNAIREALEHHFGRKLRTSDELPAKFLQLAAQSGIGASEIVRWIHEKMDEKRGFRYHVSSPGALLSFAAEDLRVWVELTRTEIRNRAVREEREATSRRHRAAEKACAAGAGSGAEPFTPESYGPTMEDLKKSTRMK